MEFIMTYLYEFKATHESSLTWHADEVHEDAKYGYNKYNSSWACSLKLFLVWDRDLV